jgi:hypothetical protein
VAFSQDADLFLECQFNPYPALYYDFATAPLTLVSIWKTTKPAKAEAWRVLGD